MTPSARTYTGIMQIFFGGSTASGVRGQHAVDFPPCRSGSPSSGPQPTPSVPQA